MERKVKQMTQPKAYLMVGIPGAGKSTWVKNNLPSDTIIISRDIIRARLGFTQDENEKAVLSHEQEQLVTDVEYKEIEGALFAGYDVAIDDTNTGRFRKRLIDFLRECGAKVIGVNLNTPLETCIERRKGQIPADVMQRIFDKKVDLGDNEVDELLNIE